MPAKDAARQAVFDAIGHARDEIAAVGRAMHAQPELPGDEQQTAETIINFLEAQGYTVERGIGEQPTAFRARKEHLDRRAMRRGARHPHIGLVMRLDGTSDGHIYGHNQAAAAVLATAAGVSAALEHENAILTVYGCPGPTTGGGLLALARTGMFEEADIILGAQPAGTGDGFFYTINSTGDTLGSLTAKITFAGDVPESVISDAVERMVTTAAVVNATLGEHESVKISFDPNSVTGVIRALTRRRITEIAVDMQLAANDIAEPLGLTASFAPSNVYDEMVVNRILARRVKTFSDNLKLRLDKIRKGDVGEPTPWGNVSYYSPTFIAHYPIVERDVAFGTRDFASAANTPEAYEASMRLGECLAFTALDVIRDATFRAIADDQLVKAMAERGIRRAHRRWTGLHPVIPDPEDERDPADAKPAGPKVTEFKWVRGPGLPN
jgi:metal-dependent amidase/aminoacylase/carboxypeptidase family protein